MTADLAVFLLARIAEDEAVVAKLDREWGHAAPTRTGPGGYVDDDEYDGIWVAPARVLAECKAKRRIVELHREVLIERPDDDVGIPYDALCEVDNDDFPCATLRLLALPYADHPDWREEWRP